MARRPATAEVLLAVHGVEKSFVGRKVVKGVSLYVRKGEAVGLLGPNGAGKTTVFYMITGLIKADQGRIELDGRDVTRLPMYQRARLGIGYLPQEASIFRGLSVEENIRAVLEVVEPDAKRRERDLDALLDEFNIARLRKTPAIALSGGERRRVEIARALATRPNYMLLDEPFAGIDPIAVGDIQALVRHLTNRGIGVLITDHNVRETLGLTDRAYIIYSGEVLMEGRADDIVNNPDVRRLYLGRGVPALSRLKPQNRLATPRPILLYTEKKQESDQFSQPRPMALSQRLQLRQSQALVMTPQLMQAIKLLQLSNLDLVAYVEAELERNPLLDRRARDRAAGAAARLHGEAPSTEPDRQRRGAKRPRTRADTARPTRNAPTTALDDTSPDDSGTDPAAHVGHARPAIRNGPAPAPAAATTATTIWKPLFPPRPRWRTGFANS